MKTTSSKAVAAGIAGNLVVLANWAVSLIPVVRQMPDEPRAALYALISAGIAAAVVYFAPANKALPEPSQIPPDPS